MVRSYMKRINTCTYIYMYLYIPKSEFTQTRTLTVSVTITVTRHTWVQLHYVLRLRTMTHLYSSKMNFLYCVALTYRAADRQAHRNSHEMGTVRYSYISKYARYIYNLLLFTRAATIHPSIDPSHPCMRASIIHPSISHHRVILPATGVSVKWNYKPTSEFHAYMHSPTPSSFQLMQNVTIWVWRYVVCMYQLYAQLRK